jgi:FAD/FMN-containing dehydrogenase
VNSSSSVSSIANLRDALKGRVILPGEPGYDEARRVFPGNIDRCPAVVARPAHADDVARIIASARESGLPLAVRSGGHSGAGHGTIDDGIVIDVRDLKSFDIDVANRTVWAGTGLSAAEYSQAASAHGLATGFGDTGSVGIGGITLGGGIGYLTRKYGLAIDSVLGAEIVTADGRTLQIDHRTHPDLFWAIRGGGGNFGVVTRIKYQLHPVDHVVGGILILPATAEVVERATQVAASAPEELTAIINVMSAPPMPFLPAALHGKLVTMIMLCYAGDAAAGAAAVAPLRAIAPPLADLVRPIRYPELFPPDDPSFHPTATARTLFLDSVDRSTAETIIDFLQKSDAPLRAAQIRPLGGEMARVPSEATAFAHRQCRILVNVAAFYQGPQDRPRREAWVQELASAIDQGNRGAYVGFLMDEGPARVQAAYPGATWTRLARVKAKYDPDNVFRLNQNVPPRT